MTPFKSPHALLLPGSFTGGWIWERYFAPAMRAKGWDVTSHTFRSHRANDFQRHVLGMHDFVQEVERAVQAMMAKPWIIAHSLGGRVALEYITRRTNRDTIAGLILLSPAPPDGMWRVATTMAQYDPVSFGKFATLSVMPEAAKAIAEPPGIYSDAMPYEDMQYCNQQWQGESARVLMEAQAPMWRSLSNLGIPIMVMGAEGDKVIPASSVKHTARLLDAPYVIYPGSSHSMMVDVGWQNILDAILDWIGDQAKVSD